MAIDFPDSPALNDYFESSGKAWTFNGTSWDIVQTPANLSIANGSITAPKLASGVAVANIGYTPADTASPTFTGTVTLPDNTVALGTKTTGDYVASLVAGTGVTLTNNAGETATPTVTIGQAVGTSASVTFAKVDTTGDLTVGGNLTVNGTTTTLNTETLAIEDNIVVLNSNVTGSPATNAGIEVERGTSENVLVRWNETSDKWEVTNDGTTYGNIVNTADSGTVTSTMIADGTIVNADVSASAAIALSKLASGTSAQVVIANASGVPTYTTLSGDVTISDTGVTSIAANSVALGTDTTGNYMSGLSASTGISVTHTPSEGSTGTVAIDTAVVPQLGSTNTFSTNQIISGSTTAALLRITQTGTGNAFAVTDSTGGDGLFINANGGLRTNNRSAEWRAWSDTAGFGAPFYFDRSRGTTYDSHTAVQSGDDIGSSLFRGSDGTAFRSAATISAQVDGTVSSNIVPGRLIFSTANSSGTNTERMRINSAGNVGIGTGSPSELLHISSTGSASILIEADTDNVNESDVPTLKFSQDGGQVTAQVGIDSSNNFAIQHLFSTGNMVFLTNNGSGATERMRIDSIGQVGIGATPSAGDTLRVSKNLTGATGVSSVYASGQIQSDVTASARIFRSSPSTANSIFTITSIIHFNAIQGTYSNVSAGGEITNQYGFATSNNITGATNNYGFFSDIAAATGRWNFYANGTAANRFAGRVGIGAELTSGAMAQVANTTAADKAFIIKGAASQSGNLFEIQNSAGTALVIVDSGGQAAIGAIQSATGFNISKSITGSTNAQAIRVASSVASGVTGEARYMTIVPSVDASVAAGNLVGIKVFGATLGDGASITTQYGFWVDSGFTTGTTNYGFYGNIASGSGRWNLYINGTADNYLAGNTGIGGLPVANIKLHVAGNASNDTNPEIRITGSGTSLDIHNNLGAGAYNNIVSAGSKGLIAIGANSTTSRASFVIAPWSDADYGIRFEGGSTTNILQWGTTIFQPSATTSVAAVVKGRASQTANLQEWQNSAGSVLAYVAADGTSSFGNAADSDQAILASSIFS
jgi:hypothetical protein